MEFVFVAIASGKGLQTLFVFGCVVYVYCGLVAILWLMNVYVVIYTMEQVDIERISNKIILKSSTFYFIINCPLLL